MLLAALLLLLVGQEPAPVVAARSALAAAETNHGPDSLAASDAANSLGNRLVDASQFEAAIECFERVLRIRVEQLGDDHAKTRVALSNLANVCMLTGDSARSLTLLDRAVASFVREGVEDQAKVAVLLSLGGAHRWLGHYRQSREALEQAVAVAERVCPQHAYAALAKRGLGSTLMDYGEVDRARVLFEAALGIAEREPDSQPCAHAVFGIGIVLANAGRYDEALPALQRGMQLVRKAFGADSIKFILSAAMQAGVLHEAGKGAEAAAVARELLVAAKDRTGAFARARCLAHGVLSATAAAAGRADEGLVEARAMMALLDPAWIAANDLARQWTVYGNALAAAAQRADAIAAFRRAIEIFTKDAADHGIGDGVGQVDVRTALAAVLAAHGDVAGAIVERQRALDAFRRNVDLLLPVMLEAQRLRVVQRHRGNLDALLASARDHAEVLSPERQHAEVLAWKGQVARGIGRNLVAARANPETAAALARLQQLVRESGGNPADQSLLRERQELSTRLAAMDGVATELVLEPDFAALLAADAALVDFLLVGDADGKQHFVAFVARPGRATVRVDLGAHAALRAAVSQHLLLTSRRTRPGLGGQAIAAAASGALRSLLWQPLLPALEGVQHVVISPDDVLAELPFETLPGTSADRFLVEDLAISYVQSGLELARAPVSVGAPSLLAIGDIDYGTALASGEQRAGAGPFAPLPFARQELAEVRALFGDGPVTVLAGSEATEARLASAVVGASYVHLATHGFCRTARAGAGAGVALTAANLGRSEGRADDGILSSEEAALLDLRACRLVALSACQSGLGTPVSGEHLLGLRRSLHIAGAQATLTSLWRVDDAATASLMADFYRALWQQQLSPAVALRRVQLGRIASQRASGEVLPATWGAFVVEGN